MKHTRDWFVSSGGAAIGPVTLDEILAEVSRGWLAVDAWVWKATWSEARPLESVRELVTVDAATEVDEAAAVDEWCAWLDDARDAGELLAMTLQGLVLATNASVGIAHAPYRDGSFVATCAVGRRGADLLGTSSRARDAALARAKLGAFVVPRATATRAGAASLERLGELDAQSVALTPVWSGGKLLAIFELGRGDHPFRMDDDRYLRGTAETARARAGLLRQRARASQPSAQA